MSQLHVSTVTRRLVALLFLCFATFLVVASFKPARTAAAPPAAPGVPRFQNYPSPPGIANDAGEPSIGCNWQSEKRFSNSMFSIPNGGRVMLFGGFSPDLYRTTFDDCSSPAKPNWEAKPLLLASTPRAAGDPILFTDHDTGRTFVSQLEGLTPAGSTTDITDDDGDTFTPSEGSSLPSDIDHQTFGGGRFHDPAPPTVGYPHAVYYASQSVSDARAALSVDGGLTFGPAFPMYTINECAGLHGHIKVSPKDGTVYVPNVGCGGSIPFHETGAKQAVIVSEDNGITWNIRPIPDSTTHGNGSADNTIVGTRDPSVSIDAAGNVYFVYQAEDRLTPNADGTDIAGDTHPKVAVSHDHGLHWEKSIDVGAKVINGNPVRNATFVAATAGSAGRAAVAFFGTETGGSNWPCGEGDDCSLNVQGEATGINARPLFTGVWYLYVSTTFDGGKTWTTQNVTPGDPTQRGGICNTGTCRNLLDFMDIQIDKEGRVLVAGEDGCVDACVDGGSNSFTAKGFITRQSGGKRLIATFDPKEPVLAGAPLLEAVMNATKTQVTLQWPAPDNGGSDITGYKIYRRKGTTGSFSLLATVPQTNFTDTSPAPNAKNFYRITAVNGLGEGPYCHDVEAVLGPPLEVLCKAPGVTELTDAAGDASVALGIVGAELSPGMDLLSFQLAQPFQPSGDVKLVFRINTDPGTSPQPAGSAWYVSFKRPDGKYRGVHMAWRGTTPTFESYEPDENSNHTTDGRFVVSGSEKPAEPESHYDPDAGLVEIVVKASDLGLKPGDTIQGFNAGVTQSTDPLNIGAANATDTYDEMPDGLGYTGAQRITANLPCVTNQPPIAALTATPTSGYPPLQVTFNAKASHDPDAGDSIASYTFNFGDGSEEETRNIPTINHTYTHGGAFFATCRVKDSHGLVSTNVASVTVRTGATLFNISTREHVLTGDNVAIGGFIIRGAGKKPVLIRGIGPSLSFKGHPLPGRMKDPTLELYNSKGEKIGSNDNWQDGGQQAAIKGTGLAPHDNREAAILKTLAPGGYTAILRGKDNSTGIALVEAYDLDTTTGSQLANISTRGFVGTGDNVMIGGFFAGANTAAPAQVVIRAIGPSMKTVPDRLDDPKLDVFNENGDKIASNDNWKDHQEAGIQKTGLAPKDNRESAVLMNSLEPGFYTAIVRGKKNATGNALVEIYNLNAPK